jgi:hypothetical protein
VLKAVSLALEIFNKTKWDCFYLFQGGPMYINTIRIKVTFHTASAIIAVAIAAVCLCNCAGPESSGASIATASDVASLAETLVQADPVLQPRLKPQNVSLWLQDSDGAASTLPLPPGFQGLSSHLPARADGIWEVGYTSSKTPLVKLTAQGATGAALALDRGRAVYRDAHPSTDAIYVTGSGYVEELLLLRDANAPAQFTWNVELGSGVVGMRRAKDGGLDFVDKNGTVLLRMPRPFAIDAIGQKRTAEVVFDSSLVTVRLDTNGLTYPMLLDPPLETATWELAVIPKPETRFGHAMATLDSKVVLFGGFGSSGYLGDTWEWDGSNWTQKFPETSPAARYRPAMATRGSTVVLFGGMDSSGNLLSDTWEWDGTNWSLKTPSTNPPARYVHAMVTLGSTVILFGGYDYVSYLNDTWEWDGNNWSLKSSVDNPSGRLLPAMATRGSTAVLFGGYGGAGPLSDTWEWDGTSWSLKTPGTNPPVRYGHAMATLDSTVVLFGGYGGAGPLSDTWEWDGTNWSLTAPATSPEGRDSHAMASLGSAIVLFGGSGSSGYLNDTWVWNSTDWSQQEPITPQASYRPAMATRGTTVVLFGGQGDSGRLNETWEWNGTNWYLKAPATSPEARDSHAMASLGSTVILFGGYGDAGILNDTWEWDGTNWTLKSPTSSPSGRYMHAMATLGSTVVLFGGYDESYTMKDDTWEWNGTDWAQKSTTASPPARAYHAMVSLETTVILFGGEGDSGYLDDTWEWDGTNWTQKYPITSPPMRYGHAMASLGSKVVLFGGEGDSGYLDDTWEWCGTNWFQKFTSLSPSARAYHAMTGLGTNGAVLFGGFDGDFLVDTWNYSSPPQAQGAACCGDSNCLSGFCVDGFCCTTACGNGAADDCQACSVAAGASADGTCTIISSDHVCRTATDLCDADENCTGDDAVCPSDIVQSVGTPCRVAASDCDLAASCDGISKTCPANAFKPVTTICRAATDLCDADENCTGDSATCPATDAVKTFGTQCRAAASDCDLAASCDGSAKTCPANTFKPTTALCRAAGGDCDVAENCTGVDAACPTDIVQSSGTQCRVAASDCDLAASCDGLTKTCPANGYKSHTTLCRDVAGDCDVAEYCTGSSATCPTNAFKADSTECRAASCHEGMSIVAANCSGTTATCSQIQNIACDAYICGPTACLTSCALTIDCADNYFCEETACEAKRINGNECSRDEMCLSTHCKDGVCCNNACRGQCEACNEETHLGTCVAAVGVPRNGRDPCTNAGTACGGTCDGTNALGCAYPTSTTQCRAASCADGMATLAAGCDGAGACPATQTQLCSPYDCGEIACAGDCLIDSDCIATQFCSGGTCVPRYDLASLCASDTQCQSGHCADGRCCDMSCDGQCEACDEESHLGACVAVVGDPRHGRTPCANDESVCTGSCDGSRTDVCAYPGSSVQCRAPTCEGGVATLEAVCDGNGACPAVQTLHCEPYVCSDTTCDGNCTNDNDCNAGYFCRAHICTEMWGDSHICAGSNQCQNGNCVDGVCCNTSCEGQCEACAIAETLGVCSPVTGAPLGSRPACAGDGIPCAGSCNGVLTTNCVYPDNSVECRPATCGNEVATLAAVCDGLGACPVLQRQSCRPNRCVETACAGNCLDDSDCIETHYCSANVCIPKLLQGATCGGSNQCRSGHCVDTVCCDQACAGQCQACNVSGALGACTVVVGTPHTGRPNCAGVGVCKGSCNGSLANQCAYPGAATECSPAACNNGIGYPATSCNSTGACSTSQPVQCGNYACGEQSCKTSCTVNADCAGSNVCFNKKCIDPADLRYSGGCNVSSHDNTGFGLVLFSVLVLLWLRTSARMRRVINARRGATMLTLLICGVVLVSANARAADPGFAAQTFELAPAGDRWLANPEAAVAGHLNPRGAILFDYSYGALQLIDKHTNEYIPKTAILKNQVYMHLDVSLSLFDRVLINVDAPVALYQSGDKPIADMASIASASFADLRAGIRVAVLGKSHSLFALALAGDVWFPTGSRDAYTGDGAVRFNPKVIASGLYDRWLAYTVNVGFLVRKERNLSYTTIGNAMTFGAGVAAVLGGGRVQIGPEVFGRAQFEGMYTSPIEALIGTRIRINGFIVSAGLSTALNYAAGGAHLRVFAGFAWSPET